MTHIADPTITENTIIGPFSPWPGKRRSRRPAVIATGAVASIGIFLHCVAPMLIGG